MAARISGRCSTRRKPRRARVHYDDDAMRRIAADRLVWHSERSGHMVMKRPPAPSHGAPYSDGAEWGQYLIAGGFGVRIAPPCAFQCVFAEATRGGFWIT